MHITPSEAYDPIDIASLCLWKQEQSGDNQDRIRRLLCNLPLAVQQELTPRQRQCMELCVLQGLSQVEAGRQLGVNKATVCRHLKKAKRALRRAAGYAGLPV